MKRILISLVVLSSIGLLFAGKFWNEQPYQEWSQKQAVEMLSKSPWASTQTFTETQPSGANSPSTTTPGGWDQPASVPTGGSNERRTADVLSRQYRMRLQSAAPIRMALARLGMLRGSSPAQAQEFVDSVPMDGKIVFMLSVGVGQDRTELDRVTTDTLKNETFLVLKKSKRRIVLEQYLSPSEVGGTEAVFVFPREEIGLEEKEMRFICELSAKTKINRKFKLKDMVFKGELML